MNIIGLSGVARSGKDTVADVLVREHGFVKVALADEMKRMVWRLWPDLTSDDLWGPSENRERPLGSGTLRMALQTLGTEWARHVDDDVWVRIVEGVAKALFTGHYDYSPNRGLVERTRGAYQHVRRSVVGVVIPDVRFPNEATFIRGRAGGVVWRVIRTGAGLKGEAGRHESETAISDSDATLGDRIMLNNDTLDILAARIAANMKEGKPYVR